MPSSCHERIVHAVQALATGPCGMHKASKLWPWPQFQIYACLERIVHALQALSTAWQPYACHDSLVDAWKLVRTLVAASAVLCQMFACTPHQAFCVIALCWRR
jgi:hypothetical protein